MRIWKLALCSLLAFWPALSFAQTTVQIGRNTGDDIASGDTRELTEATPAVVTASTDCYVSTYAAPDERHCLFQVDFSSLPTAQNVTSAIIGCYQLDYAGSNINLVEWRRVLPPANVAQATWNSYSTGNAWNTGGGKTNGTDRDADVSFLGPAAATTSAYVFYTATADGLADIEAAMGVGTVTWLAQRANSTTNNYVLCRGSGETDGFRMYLELTYEPAGGGGSAVPKSRGLLSVPFKRKLQ